MIKPPGIRFDRQRTSWEKVPGASFCLMTACCDQRQVRNNGTMEIPDSHKKRKNNNEMHPPPRRVFQGFLENPPPRKYQLVVFVLFPRVFIGRLFCSRPKAVLTMTQNIIQEQKDEARRIVEEQVACYIGCLDAVSTFLVGGNVGKQLMLVVSK